MPTLSTSRAERRRFRLSNLPNRLAQKGPASLSKKPCRYCAESLGQVNLALIQHKIENRPENEGRTHSSNVAFCVRGLTDQQSYFAVASGQSVSHGVNP